MRILILTHPLITNYGGILQNYALQKVLLSMGHRPVTIDWYPEQSYYSKIRSFAVRVVKHFLFGKKRKTNLFISHKEGQRLRKITPLISHFIETKIEKTSYLSSMDRVRKYVIVNQHQYDAFIVGSDQVWIDNMAPFTFLDFINADYLKIAYAASFGGDTWPYSKKKTLLCSDLLKQFSLVTVREKSSIELCRKHMNIDVTQVLDPSLLLTSGDYLPLVDKSLKKTCELAVYILDQNSSKNDIVHFIRKTLKKEAFWMTTRKAMQDENLIDGADMNSIEDWLAVIWHSDFVVTDSFHGTVFAILFNKPFIAISNSARGNARFVSLLSMFGLEKRLVESGDAPERISKLLVETIDYEQVNLKLSRMRDSSINLLKTNLSKNESIMDFAEACQL